MECAEFFWLTTDNCLKSLKYGDLIGLNQFLPKNATSFADYSPESPDKQTEWSKSIVMQIRGKFVCEQRELFIKQRFWHMELIYHSVVAILRTAILCTFYEFFTKTVERKKPRISHDFRTILKIVFMRINNRGLWSNSSMDLSLCCCSRRVGAWIYLFDVKYLVACNWGERFSKSKNPVLQTLLK